MSESKIGVSDVAASWNRNAEAWSSEVRAGLDLYRELYTFPAFLDFTPSVARQDVIDLGCGEGSSTRAFARLGGRMTGIDVSEELIRLAREKEKSEFVGVAYEVGSYNDLASFPDAQFDCAVSTMALMDGPDVSAAFQSAYRVLRRGGWLCFSILHPCFITPAAQWLKDEVGAYSGLRVGRYFERSPFVEHWSFGRRSALPAMAKSEARFEVPRFPRTLSDYVNALVGAGFRIDKLEEPRPSEEISREHEWLARWHQHAPLVLFVLASKT
jgi:SAM-dependent methyltransferase